MLDRTLTKIIACALILLVAVQSLGAYKLTYREQLYKLHHRELYMDDADIVENIHWLELALKAEFANPLNALATIRTPRDWEKYRYLFTMHLELKMVELYLRWGTRYNKFNAYFYNAPFKEQNLESLDIAERRFRYALVYWNEALTHAKKAGEFKWITLVEVQQWEDELWRIQNGELDYEAIINKHLLELETVRAAFKAMDESTY